jgi:hypothetical protein
VTYDDTTRFKLGSSLVPEAQRLVAKAAGNAADFAVVLEEIEPYMRSRKASTEWIDPAIAAVSPDYATARQRLQKATQALDIVVNGANSAASRVQERNKDQRSCKSGSVRSRSQVAQRRSAQHRVFGTGCTAAGGRALSSRLAAPILLPGADPDPDFTHQRPHESTDSSPRCVHCGHGTA